MITKFKLVGLNKPWKAAGFHSIYATLDKGNEDWFHCTFDEKEFPDDRLSALFNLFTNDRANHWHGKNHMAEVEYEGNRKVIKKLFLDGVTELKPQ